MHCYFHIYIFLSDFPVIVSALGHSVSERSCFCSPVMFERLSVVKTHSAEQFIKDLYLLY